MDQVQAVEVLRLCITCVRCCPLETRHGHYIVTYPACPFSHLSNRVVHDFNSNIPDFFYSLETRLERVQLLYRVLEKVSMSLHIV